jgi:hypothetical protein
LFACGSPPHEMKPERCLEPFRRAERDAIRIAIQAMRSLALADAQANR